MKKLFFIVFGLATLSSCEKGDLFDKKDKDNPCPVVSSEMVPSAVTTSFQMKYPNNTVDTWFNKDNVAYSAMFTLNGKQTLSQFKNDGTFVKEEIEVDQQGEHEDNNDDNDSGCECETEDED